MLQFPFGIPCLIIMNLLQDAINRVLQSDMCCVNCNNPFERILGAGNTVQITMLEF